MLRSISFVIEGMVTTQVRVTANLDGTLSFELTRLGTGSVGDLEAVFLDLNGLRDGDGFKVFGDAGLTLGAIVEDGVDTLGRAARIQRAAVDGLGDFDIGIAFGPLSPDRGAPRKSCFTLARDTAPLTLDMIDMADFALRYAWPGADPAEAAGVRTPGAGGRAPVGQGALEVIEPRPVCARPLADDSNGGVLTVIDLHAAREPPVAFAVGPEYGPGDGIGRRGGP